MGRPDLRGREGGTEAARGGGRSRGGVGWGSRSGDVMGAARGGRGWAAKELRVGEGRG